MPGPANSNTQLLTKPLSKVAFTRAMATSLQPASTPPGRAGEVYQHHLGIVHIPGVFQQLLGKLRAALAHRHGAQGAVAGVGIGAEVIFPQPAICSRA